MNKEGLKAVGEFWTVFLKSALFVGVFTVIISISNSNMRDWVLCIVSLLFIFIIFSYDIYHDNKGGK